jgi:hypothetical protein
MNKHLSNLRNSLQRPAFLMIGVLVIEYLLGVVTTLLVEFPEGENEQQLWVFASQQLPLLLHIIIGTLLLVGTVVFFIKSIKQKNRQWIIASGIATAAILGGAGAGSAFIPKQSEIYASVMSICLFVALLSYFWGLYVTKESTQKVQ